MHKEWELYLLAEERRGLDAEADVTEMIAVTARPTAMRPRPHHQQVRRARIILLDRAIGVERPHRVFGVEPAADVEHGALHVIHKSPQRARLPELVIIRVVNDLLPVTGLAIEQLLIYLAE